MLFSRDAIKNGFGPLKLSRGMVFNHPIMATVILNQQIKRNSPLHIIPKKQNKKKATVRLRNLILFTPPYRSTWYVQAGLVHTEETDQAVPKARKIKLIQYYDLTCWVNTADDILILFFFYLFIYLFIQHKWALTFHCLLKRQFA